MVNVPMGSPVCGSSSLMGVLVGEMTRVVPAMLMPVTSAVVPFGRLALMNTLPVAVWPIGVTVLSGASV
jgi:hypothetical protein